MRTVKEALTRLWEEGYFRPPSCRSTKEVETKVSNTYGCTYSNWNTLLKRTDFLRQTRKGWVQKQDFHGDDKIKVVLIENGKPRQAIKTFKEVVQTFDGPLCISDPYLTYNAMDLLEILPSKEVKFLFHKSQTKLSQKDINDFKKENPHIKLKRYPNDHLHDRYILSSKRILIIGHGLSMRNKETFVIELSDNFASDLRLSLVQTFNRRWKESTEI